MKKIPKIIITNPIDSNNETKLKRKKELEELGATILFCSRNSNGLIDISHMLSEYIVVVIIVVIVSNSSNIS